MGLAADSRAPVVLVVEDEPLLLMMAIATVEDAGLFPLAAHNSAEALRILESRDDIRLVFSDIDMPGEMDGVQLMTAVRNRWPPVGLILTSGHRLPDPSVIPEGCLFFGKPYNTDALIVEMQRLAH